MKFSVIASMTALSLLAGCQSTTLSNTTKPTAPLVDLSNELEGSTHKVWKEVSFKGIRSELKDGEVIIFKDVVAKPSYNNSEYYYIGHIYSADNQLLFDKKYTLADVGVVKFKGNKIDKAINPDVVSSTRGIRYHGNSDVVEGFSSTYWKSSGGDTPRVMPVRDYKSSITGSHKIAENNWTGLRLTCISNSIYASFNNEKNIYAADNEDITVTVSFPYTEGKRYRSKAIGHTGVSLKVDPYIERILLEEDAIKFVAYSHANREFTEVTAYNNGLAEAYTRVKNNCSM
ncbi:hypothetical protein [Aliivibrio fischeri]|uniref:hypothetical protein n=1 Tax=Aliivibrio fischeri TaxID=668 RepID=UPI00084CCBCE|nr:hypothetical protein [Aliivibrio fischeri]OED53482.1 hypothetical protein BEI46_17615 [Aliivibrio fischeri]